MKGLEARSWREYWETLALSSDPLAAIDGWDLTRARYRKKCRELAAALSLGPGERVLNIGCGPGLFERLAARRAGRWVAMDLAWNMARRAKENNRGNEKLRVVQGNALKLPFASAVFDKALAHAVTQYLSLEEVGVMLREMKRVTKTNAVIFVGDVPERISDQRVSGRLRAVYAREGALGLLKRLALRLSSPSRQLLKHCKLRYLLATSRFEFAHKPVPISQFSRHELTDLARQLGLDASVLDKNSGAYYGRRFSLLLTKRRD